MIEQIRIVCRKEWKNFTGSHKGVFAVYALMALVYALVFVSNRELDRQTQTVVWWVFFSLIITGSSSNTVFVAERVNGSLEILLTCGLSRGAILAGKVLFVVLISLLIGMVPFTISTGWALAGTGVAGADFAGPLLFAAATFMNASSAAWLSVRLTNPRLLHFVNLIIVSAALGVGAAAGAGAGMLALGLAVTGALFFGLARRAFAGERVVQPVNL